jgi:hypothetical protein
MLTATSPAAIIQGVRAIHAPVLEVVRRTTRIFAPLKKLTFRMAAAPRPGAARS